MRDLSLKRASVVAFFLILSTVFATSPASAEITAGPTTSWGVDGLATGTQNDSIRSSVFAIEQIGNRIYMGGRFLEVTSGGDSFSRPYLAAFDATTGAWIDTFTPGLDGSVNALQASPDGTKLFVGGDFDTVNGQGADAFVALDPITGAVSTSWSGALTSAAVVRGFDLVGNWLYVVGGFNGVASPAGNNQAFRAVRFNWQTGAHDPNWRPTIQGGSIWGVAASTTADRVYLAGDFLTANGQAVTGGFAALTASDASLVTASEPFPLNTKSVTRQYLYDVVVTNGHVFVGGSEHFVAVLAESDLSLERFHLSSSRGDYQDLEVVGSRVYAGCHCRASAIVQSSDDVLWYGSPPVGVTNGTVDATSDNTWITAFSATTGEVDAGFQPNVTAERAGVWAIHGALDGCLWFGGDLTGTNGTAVDKFVRMCDPANVDTQRPSTPGKPSISQQGPDTVDLAWTPSTDDVGVTGYDLYDADTDQIILSTVVPSGSETTASLTGLTPGTHRYYTKANDAAGNESYRSGIRTVEITGTTIDTQRPTTPGKPRIVQLGSDVVDLDWNPSIDNVGVTEYRIYDDDSELMIASSTEPSVTVSELAPATYRFYARAVDAAGNESYRSGSLTFTITGGAIDVQRPSTPGKPSISQQGPDTVDLAWTPSTDDVGVTGYDLYDADTDQIILSTVVPSGSETTASLTGLTPGTHRYYTKANDAAGNESYRSGIRTVEITGTTIDTQRPTTPSGLATAATGLDWVDLVWNPSGDNVAVTGYHVYDDSTDQIVATTTVDDTTISGLASGAYTFYVKAFDAAGNESWRSNLEGFTIN